MACSRVPGTVLETAPKVGGIPGFRRLVELGWAADSAPLATARRALFRLLPEDNDPEYLYELADEAGDDPDLIQRGRLILREAAAAALAQAGYEADPRLRGAARRILERVGNFLRLAGRRQAVHSGGQPARAAGRGRAAVVLHAGDAGLHAAFPERAPRAHGAPLSRGSASTVPRMAPVQQVGETHLIEQPHLVLGDILPTRYVMDQDMPTSLAWLELMARLGFLQRNEGWTKLLDKLLDDRDRYGIWHPPRSVSMPEQVPDWVWPTMPLSDRQAEGDDYAASVTFRLGLIAKLAGREIELV